VHLNAHGDRLVAEALDAALFGAPPAAGTPVDRDALRAAVNEKNLQFFYDHRAVNGFYIYGGRKNPFGTVNFPVEFAKLRKMIAVRDRRVWDVAQGKRVSERIDDSGTGPLPEIPTNRPDAAAATAPEASLATFTLADGYEANLFASEREFPELGNPVQVAFDARGRLWVCTMQTYPQYNPGTPVHDKVLILEDTNADGRADKCTVFADGLHLPTGLEFGRGGIFVAQQPNVLFLEDTDGDDKADVREYVLHGFDSADSHHSISAFTYDQGGGLYLHEGTFHHSQVESPWGPTRLVNAGVFRWEPRSERFGVFVSYAFANPWGHAVDRWGQNFIADASGGANYWGTAFSGDVDYPAKHATMKQFLTKQWRPTAACELVSSRNFPDDVQGDYLLTNCIGFHGVLHYRMRDEASGFAADPVEPLLRTTDQNVRLVDLEFGPDGALYLCDWFNPLVGHMQHSLRDPNRDHLHGRIWRVRCTKRPLVKPAAIAGQAVAALLDLLVSEPEERTRARVRSELWNRDTAEVLAAVDRWTAGLDPKAADHEHHLLEALWLHQAHDVVHEARLRAALRSPDFRARAAATRVLAAWRDRVSQPLELLATQVADEHPRVRLEAVRALSFFHDEGALAVALRALLRPMDDYLHYTLDETINTLEGRIRRRQPAASVAAPLVALIEEKQVPAERLPDVVRMICQRGEPSELASVFKHAMQGGYAAPLRLEVFDTLLDTATTRKVKPAGDLTAIGGLIRGEGGVDGRLREAAVRLASAWRLDVSRDLQRIALAGDDAALRRAAVDGLIAIGDQTSQDTLVALTERGQPGPLRVAAVAGLARSNLERAAARAAVVLSESGPQDDPAALVEAFLNRKDGPDALAAALAREKLHVDVAKLALRCMYAAGRSDKLLSDTLVAAAGMAADSPPPTSEEVATIAADMNCLKCHALHKAGGDVGPELTSVGAVSPVDFVVNSILNPDLAIKEQYVTKIIQTAAGEVFTGIIVSRDNVRVRLKEATGKTIDIATADIEEEVEGQSLMPKGLARFLTHDELVDLVAFISQLGKPGPYAVRTAPVIQRWRLFGDMQSIKTEEAPFMAQFEGKILGSDKWQPVYARSGGDLPLDELRGGDSPLLYVQGEIAVNDGGLVTVEIDAPEKFLAWVGTETHHGQRTFTTRLDKGTHKLTLRVAPTAAGQAVKVRVSTPAGSTARVDVVGGA
jgi:putative heme-binding domain-containing protein